MDDTTLNVVAPRLLENAAEWDQREAHTSAYRHAEAQTQRDLYYYMLGREQVVPPEWRPTLEHAGETENDPERVLFQLLRRKMQAQDAARPHKQARTEHPTVVGGHTSDTRLLPSPFPPAANLQLRILGPAGGGSGSGSGSEIGSSRHRHTSSLAERTLTFPAYQAALERARAADEQQEEEDQVAGSGLALGVLPAAAKRDSCGAKLKRTVSRALRRKRKRNTGNDAADDEEEDAEGHQDSIHPELRLQTPKLTQLLGLLGGTRVTHRYPWLARNVAFTTEAQRARTGYTEAYISNTFKRQ